MFGPTNINSLLSDVSGLQLVQHVHLPVAACLTVLLLPVGFLLHIGQEVAVFLLFKRRTGLLQADGGAAGFGDGGVGVVVKVVVGDGCFSPAGLSPGRLPLSPFPLQRCLGLDANKDSQMRNDLNSNLIISIRSKIWHLA